VGFNVPALGQVLHVTRVVIIPEPRVFSITTGFSVVLSGRLSVHLVDTATGFTNVASKQLNVVDLTGARGRLVTLVDTLKGRGEYCLARPDDFDRLSQEFRGNAGNLMYPLRRVALDDTLQLFDPDRVLLDILLVDISSLEHFPLHTVE